MSKPPNPSAESTKESTSKSAGYEASSRRLTANWQAIPTTTVSATSSQKKLRQPRLSTIAPPIVGPMFGANPIAMPEMPIAVALRPSGKRVMAIVCTSGKSMPAATACAKRPKNSTPKLGAIAETSAPTANNAMAISVRSLRRNRPMKYEDRGTTTPNTSIYDVVSHCPTPSAMPNSAHTEESMAFRPVWAKFPTDDANTTNANNTIVCRCSFSRTVFLPRM